MTREEMIDEAVWASIRLGPWWSWYQGRRNHKPNLSQAQISEVRKRFKEFASKTEASA